MHTHNTHTYTKTQISQKVHTDGHGKIVLWPASVYWLTSSCLHNCRRISRRRRSPRVHADFNLFTVHVLHAVTPHSNTGMHGGLEEQICTGLWGSRASWALLANLSGAVRPGVQTP